MQRRRIARNATEKSRWRQDRKLHWVMASLGWRCSPPKSLKAGMGRRYSVRRSGLSYIAAAGAFEGVGGSFGYATASATPLPSSRFIVGRFNFDSTPLLVNLIRPSRRMRYNDGTEGPP